jgi:hypothetical protein
MIFKDKKIMDFNTLKNKYHWKKIYGCPGRFILRNDNKFITVQELIEEKIFINSFRPDEKKDEILIVKLKNGGITSYKKPDGTFIHTLNTSQGFIRKLKMLQIDPDAIK